MDRSKILSGDQLVVKGVTKINTSLPEVGMKDVLPNGSWLEQKQIQAALEARKHLVEVDRIEKSGAISHASWSDELKLAEVTQQAGGYWQYLGHNVGKKLYLRPEETLFLMESNCLLLKHNEVVVSIQKAYSLLLSEPIGIKQYKVYASLSRIGYKVYRHKIPDTKKNSKCQDTQNDNTDEKHKENKSAEAINVSTCKNSLQKADTSNNELTINITNEFLNRANKNDNELTETTDLEDNSIVSWDTVDYDSNSKSSKLVSFDNNNFQENSNAQANQISDVDVQKAEFVNKDVNNEKHVEKVDKKNEENLRYSTLKLQMLEKRQFKPCSSDIIQRSFAIIPELFKKSIVTVSVPDEQYIPRNVFVNQTKYDLNLNLLQSKAAMCSLNERTYSTTDEVNAPHIRRLRNSSQSDTPQSSGNFNQYIHRQQNFVQFRPFNMWRPQRPQNHPFNMIFQRSFPNGLFMQQQFNFAQNRFYLRPFHSPTLGNFIQNRLSNMPDVKFRHLQSIKSLAARVKLLALCGRIQQLHMHGLHRLIDLYNATYNCRIHVTNAFDIVEEPNIVETIELDDEEPQRKKSRLATNKFDEHLNGVKELALKLKIFETSNGPKPKYRRALSNVIKNFNKAHNADIYLNKNYEIIDKRHVTLDSSSDSDCVVAETENKLKRKKLRNPFSILKKLARESNTSNENSTVPKDVTNPGTSSNSEGVSEKFNKNWLPSDDDFGRAEVVPKCFMKSRIINSFRESYIYEFIKNDSVDCLNWPEIKIAYLKYLEESEQVYMDQQKIINECNNISLCTGLKPLLKPEDCSDMGTILERLSIISTNNDAGVETKYKVDFDVYMRDVKNFRKSNPPQPHFRIVCVDESGSFPAAVDVAILNLKYEDKIPILFAVVGIASISYVQMNCIDLPIYLPRNDLT